MNFSNYFFRSAVLVFSFAVFFSCKDAEEKMSPKNDFFETSFSDYKEIKALQDYEKLTDTVVETDPSTEDYRLMELNKNGERLVVFYKVDEKDVVDGSNLTYKIIDTLQVGTLQPQERLTIGYCSRPNARDEEVIAVVKENDSIYVDKIVKAWRANLISELIEPVEDPKDVSCINEYYQGEDTEL